MARLKAVEAKATRREFLNPRVDFDAEKVITLLRLVHPAADVAAFRRLHLWFAVDKGVVVGIRRRLIIRRHRGDSCRFHLPHIPIHDCPILYHLHQVVIR